MKTLLLRLFRIKKSEYEYWVYTKEIKIQPSFTRTLIGKTKFKLKNQYFDRTGEFESKILLTKDWFLVNGYSSYIIAKNRGIEKIPVYFI